MTQKYYPWSEGLPTKPDVDALMQAFPPDSLVVGMRITDEQVRQVIGDVRGVRYRTVYSVWVKRLHRDHGINLFREETVGFFVPTCGETTARFAPAVRHMGRTGKKQMRYLSATKPENELQRSTIDHQVRLLSNLVRETKKAGMNVLPSTSAPTPVQVQPPARRLANHPGE
jgi:hypothetical protein